MFKTDRFRSGVFRGNIRLMPSTDGETFRPAWRIQMQISISEAIYVMKAKTFLVASAAALLVVSGAVVARTDESAGTGQVNCVAVDSCEGHGACAIAHNDCKAKNGGKGQGMVEVSSAEECRSKGERTMSDDRGGTVEKH
jgi:hypothetical protein